MYTAGVGKRVYVYKRKDIIATKSLYTDADVITVSSVNPSGSSLSVANLGINSSNTLFTNTNKCSILLSKADLFANETNFVMFYFDIDYAVFCFVYGSDDFEVHIDTYEMVTENDHIKPKFIVDKHL